MPAATQDTFFKRLGEGWVGRQAGWILRGRKIMYSEHNYLQLLVLPLCDLWGAERLLWLQDLPLVAIVSR